MLIDRSDINVDVYKCNEINLVITKNIVCCRKRKFNRINFIVENNGDIDVVNGRLTICISTDNINCDRSFDIYKIGAKCKDIVYVDVPFNCCFNYLVKAQIEIEEEIIKEECISF